MTPRRALALLAALLLASGARGEDAPELPPAPLVQQALAAAPAVLAARSLADAADAERAKLAAGPHEWTARAGLQQRRVRIEPAERFSEYELGLERGLRLPGKADLDRRLGDQAAAQVALAYGDARHETARALLAGWFAWLREVETARQWERQAEILARQASAARRRLELGDAPRREQVLAEGALAQAQAQAGLARARAELAAADLQARFPALVLPAQVTLGEPALPPEPAEYWREAILRRSQGLLLARAEAEQARLIAARSDLDRAPDPTLALHAASERAGEERLLGLSVSIPLPGAARRAEADLALARSRAAAQREAGTQAAVEAGARAAYLGAVAAHAAWERSRDAAGQVGRAAELAERAYRMGEGTLPDTLAARRQAHEAELGERLARLDALERRHRLRLDAGRLWPAGEAGGLPR